jgi:hypothetical protein
MEQCHARERHETGRKLQKPRTAHALARHQAQYQSTDYRPIKQMQLMRFDGKQWVRFGELLSE